jgi:hypothetical protein
MIAASLWASFKNATDFLVLPVLDGAEDGRERAVEAARRPAMMAAPHGREHLPIVGIVDRKEAGEDFIAFTFNVSLA